MADTAPKSGGTWEDLVEIFYAPSRVFARRAQGGFFVPLLVLTLAFSALFILTKPLFQPAIDAEFARAVPSMLKQNPNLTTEQIAQFKSVQERFAPIFVLLIPPISVALIAFAMWLVGWFIGSRQTFVAAMMVATFAYYPRLLEMIVNALQGAVLPEDAIKGRSSFSLGLARFVDPDQTSPLVTALALRADGFTIWVTVLVAIGAKITGRLTTGQAVAVGALVYVLGALPAIVGALRAM